MHFAAPVGPVLSGTLRALDRALLAGGRRNAWAGVLEDRRRAFDRSEAERALRAVADGAAAPRELPGA
ncbi:hypothetical protein GCM10009716_04190 [Streptomyces sodiiphilus]|uniref:Uncharacterized protein n=1 Tax=Streptomyces sodiiphilus TaxID=226217 RepID=A0ABN2NS67_9ACTN